MSYKWSHILLSGILLASTYGSGAFSSGTYNGAAAATVTPTPVPATAPIVVGPITIPSLPVTGATMGGILLIAAAAALLVWVRMHAKSRRKEL